jgi:hypothetical protein
MDADGRISAWAEFVVSRKMQAPVLFFLESHLPLVSLISTLGLLIEPLLTPFFGAERIQSLREVLSSRESTQALIAEIERYSIAKAEETRNYSSSD